MAKIVYAKDVRRLFIQKAVQRYKIFSTYPNFSPYFFIQKSGQAANDSLFEQQKMVIETGTFVHSYGSMILFPVIIFIFRIKKRKDNFVFQIKNRIFANGKGA